MIKPCHFFVIYLSSKLDLLALNLYLMSRLLVYLFQNKLFLFNSLYDYNLCERCARCFRTPVPYPKLMLSLCYKETKGSLWPKCFVVVLVVADHFTQMLHCEHECVRDLATRPGRLSPMENYLPLHYDYLQFAYYQGEWFTVQSKRSCAHGKHTERDADHHPINRLAHRVWIYHPLCHN